MISDDHIIIIESFVSPGEYIDALPNLVKNESFWSRLYHNNHPEVSIRKPNHLYILGIPEPYKTNLQFKSAIDIFNEIHDNKVAFYYDQHIIVACN